MPLTLKQLSDRLGLSPTTVSRALNGYPEVSDATRRRVMDAARAHDYRPNARAKGLATGRARTIGHVLPISRKNEMVNPIFGDIVAGAGERYGEAGYDMILSMVHDADEDRIYRDLAAKGAVDGLILHAPRVDDTRLELMARIGLPFVVHGRFGGGEDGYAWLDIDNRGAFRRATAFLTDLGHRRIALINGPETLTFAARRRQGYEEALSAAGLVADRALMRADTMTEPYGFAAAREMLARPDPPSAFLVSSMLCAIGVRRAVQDAGLALGRDVSIVTHDDDISALPNGGDGPMFTATRSSVRDAGRRCAELLIARIDAPHAPPARELWEAQLVVGDSTGPARDDARRLRRPGR